MRGAPCPPPLRSGPAHTAPGAATRGAEARELRAGHRGRRLGWALLRWTLILAVWAVFCAGVTLVWFAQDLPRPEAALDAARRPGLTLLDRSGHPFATFGDIVGDPLRLSDMPKFLPAAAVSVEDRRFWSHHGIDLVGVARAVWVNLRSGGLRQGGSTLTQQVAKNLFLSNARTFKRKVQELMLTLWLEHTFSKQEILEIWLNRVYLGSGAWGVDAAARLYFGVSARRVSLWQAAVLAGIPRAPSRFNPRTDASAAAARGREVLAAMAETGAITREQAEAASRQIAFPPRAGPNAGWFADWAAERAQDQLPPGADAVLRTTLDSRLQSVAEAKLDAMLDGPGAASNVSQGAVVALDAATGAVRALVGGRDYRAGAFNRATLAHRQPGSAFKPFVWLAALEGGASPDDTVLDAPLRIGTWSPSNFEGGYRGEITLEEALAQSVNTAAVRLLVQAGGPRVVARVAARLGIAERLPNDASLALGTGEVTPLELAAAYCAFFNGGQTVTPAGILSLEVDHRTMSASRSLPAQMVDPSLAADMVRMLGAVVSRGSGRAAAVPGRAVAGKTGTTQDYRDAWFVGGLPGAAPAAGGAGGGALVIAVWLGNDDGRPMREVTGGGLPARLFHDIAASLR